MLMQSFSPDVRFNASTSMGIGEGRSRSPPATLSQSSGDSSSRALALSSAVSTTSAGEQRVRHCPPEPDLLTSVVSVSSTETKTASTTITTTTTHTNSELTMQVWASVASWFFRPECGLLNSTAPGSTACTSTTSTTCAPRLCPLPPPPPPPPPAPPNRVPATTTSSSTSDHTEHRSATSSAGSSERILQAPTICTAIRCTVPNCSCDCFVPGKKHLRYCDTCNHGWVPHALDKLGSRHLFTNSQPEPVQPNAAFDIASLVLYGCQALPIRLKILLDRLFSVLQRDQVLQVLHGFGWTHEDYARGYILQEAHGGVLDKWSICSPEEEPLVLQQFLRFGETRAITQQLLLAQQVALAQEHNLHPPTSASEQSRVLDHPSLRSEESRRPPPPHTQSTAAHPAASRQPSTRAMSPSRRPSPPALPSHPLHLGIHPSRLHQAPPMSPHQKHSPLNFLKLPSTNGPISTTSPPSSISNSPLSVSPLNRLQNMQPFDFRKLGAGLASFPTTRVSPEIPPRRRTSDNDHVSGLNLSLSNSLPFNLPPPPPPPPVSAAMSIANSLSHSAAAMAAAAAVSVNPLAAASLVASSFPGLMSSTGTKSPSAADFLSGGGSSDFGSDDDDGDENSQSALNLSRDRDILKSPRQQRPGHIRKATTPTKRHWGSAGLPLNLGTQFINPATGKKRVQCNVCLKTFCDKGALKIHFSAVHLREMHKCTVEGCNMMFSSRRSRNRHSANPNPKLHSPHLRRKISPHDGRSAQSHPILIPPQPGLIPPGALNPLNPFSPFPLLTPPPDMRHHPSALVAMDFKHSLDLSMQKLEDAKKEFHATSSEDGAVALTTSSNHDDDDDYDDDGIVVVGGDDDDESERIDSTETNGISDQPEDFSMSSKRPKMSVSDVDEDMASNVDSNEDSLSVVDTQSLKDESSLLTTSKRKRKSQNPTRCAVPVLMEEGSLTDSEMTNDRIVFPEPPPEQHEPEELTTKKNKSEPEPEQEQPISLEVEEKKITIKKESQDEPPKASYEKMELDSSEKRKSPDVNANEKPNEIHLQEKIKIAPLFQVDQLKKEKTADCNENEESAEEKVNRPPSSVGSNKSDESLDSANALRHLESLSHGHFGDLMSRGLNLSLGSTPPQFPPLGFMMGGGPPSPARSHTSSMGSSNGADSPSEDSENQVYGHFDNGTFISTMDVPIDKDNPRKCTACDGCNAAFPSKRSRDRHSANLNLHRKLLSTSSSDKPGASLFLEKSPFASLAANPALHNEFLARLYADTQGFPLNLDAFKGHPFPPHPGNLAEQMMLNGDRIPPPPLLLPPLGSLAGFPGLTNFANHLAFPPNLNGSTQARKERSSGSNSPMSASSPPSTSPAPSGLVYCVEDELPTPDRDGLLPCRLCQKPLRDIMSLKEHCEQTHLSEMYRCSVSGCSKMFTSRTKRNLHAQNESLHSAAALRRKGSDSNCS